MRHTNLILQWLNLISLLPTDHYCSSFWSWTFLDHQAPNFHKLVAQIPFELGKSPKFPASRNLGAPWSQSKKLRRNAPCYQIHVIRYCQKMGKLCFQNPWSTLALLGHVWASERGVGPGKWGRDLLEYCQTFGRSLPNLRCFKWHLFVIYNCV